MLTNIQNIFIRFLALSDVIPGLKTFLSVARQRRADVVADADASEEHSRKAATQNVGFRNVECDDEIDKVSML